MSGSNITPDYYVLVECASHTHRYELSSTTETALMVGPTAAQVIGNSPVPLTVSAPEWKVQEDLGALSHSLKDAGELSADAWRDDLWERALVLATAVAELGSEDEALFGDLVDLEATMARSVILSELEAVRAALAALDDTDSSDLWSDENHCCAQLSYGSYSRRSFELRAVAGETSWIVQVLYPEGECCLRPSSW